MSANGVTLEFSKDSLARIKARLSPAQYTEALEIAALDLVHQGTTAAVGATPAKGMGVTPATGHAASQTGEAIDGGRFDVVARYPYARWLDTGKDSRGRVMKSLPGGYKIKAATMKAAKAAAPRALAGAAREIAGSWGK